MTYNNQPITPPDDLQEQWKQEWLRVRPAMTPFIQWMLAKSARWGYEQRGADIEDDLQKARDEELEACCEWVERKIGYGREWGAELRATRRPKPPSLKEQALEAAQRFYANGHDGCNEDEVKDDFDIIRRALESLPS